MIFRVLIFVFLIRTNGKKWYFVEDDFDTVMVVFSKAQFWKLLDRSYIQSSFSTITRHVDNSILKGALPTLKIWRTWIKIRSHSFIKTWVNMMKRSFMENHQLHKSVNLFFEEHFTEKDDNSPIFISFFLIQTTLVFKFNYYHIR